MQATAKVLVFTAIIFLTVASAGAQIVGVYSDVVSEDCILAVENVPGYVDAYVVATNTGVMGARFAAPVPTCFAGAVYISESNSGIALGNTQTGLTIILPACQEYRAVLSVITMFATQSPAIDECCRFNVIPDPAAPSGEIEIVSCSSVSLPATGVAAYVGDWAAPNYSNRSPTDGATDVPVNVVLDWDAYHCSCALGVYYAMVYFGTEPDPPLVTAFDQVPLAGPYDPGPLQPGQTYYWKLDLVDTDGGVRTTPVWSFTTNYSVADRPTTWGQLKALMSQ